MTKQEQMSISITRQQWLNEKDTATILSMSVYTLRQHRHKRIGIPYVKYGKSVRYSIADIVEYLESRTINHKKV